jgi:hypothetical protein
MLTAECKRHSGVGSRKHYTSNSAYKVDFLEHWKIRILAFFWVLTGGWRRRNRPLGVA